MTGKDLKIEDMGEFGFIRSIKDNCLFSHKGTIKGIGDDCAVIGPYDGRVILISTDLLVEDVHFILDKISPEDLGQKAVAVNISDIAAMGGTALHILISLAIPRNMAVNMLQSIYRGIKKACKHYKVNIVGGDTSASPNGLVINVAVIGETPQNEVLYRSGAKPGDVIFVTGCLGDAAAGLKLIKEEINAPEPVASILKKAQNLPSPCPEAGRKIAGSMLASAMIDLSDGLLSDLGHICEASGVGANFYQADLPVSDELWSLSRIKDIEPFGLALSGGEDYKLLVTVPDKNVGLFQKLFKGGKPCYLYRVGRIVEEKGIKMICADGSEKMMKPAGFDHFRD